MLLIRIGGSVLLLMGAFFTARHLNKKAESELLEIDGFTRLIRQISLEIEGFLIPLPKILERVDKRLLSECGYDESRVPSSLEDICSVVDFKGERCRELFLKLSADMGSGYKEEELRKLTYYKELFEDEKKRISEELPSKKKVNITLSVAAALGIIILLI